MQSAGHTGVGCGLLLTGVLLQAWVQRSTGWESQLWQCGASLLLFARSVCWLCDFFLHWSTSYVRSACCIPSHIVRSVCCMSYFFHWPQGQLVVVHSLFFTGHKVNLLCVLYSFTGREVNLLCVLYSFTGHRPDITALLTGCKTPSYLVTYFTGLEVSLLFVISSMAVN